MPILANRRDEVVVLEGKVGRISSALRFVERAKAVGVPATVEHVVSQHIGARANHHRYHRRHIIRGHQWTAVVGNLHSTAYLDCEERRLDGLQAWFTAYPFEFKATLAGDIPQLDELWTTGWRTARLCAHETYIDAPYWEQLQYVGDTRIQALISYVMTGDGRLARQAIKALDDSRTPEGLTQSRYPSAVPQFIPPFSLLWVSMLHDYWMYVDDEVLVKETLPHTRTVLDWFAGHQRPDGLLGRMRWWEFADWTATYRFGVPP